MRGDQCAGRGAESNVPKSIRAAGARTVRKLDFVLAQARSALDQLHERSAVKKRAVAGLGTFPPKRSLYDIFQTALNHPRGSIEMARRYSRSASKDVEREMHKYKRGKLRSGKRGRGGRVKSRKQAIAIGLSEARR